MSTTILVIGGATGVGKTEAAFETARERGGEIVSADSRQFYRETSVGTDKAPERMRREVPHWMMDCLSLAETMDVHTYAVRALARVRDILARGRLPVVVGGSGLYLRALTRGIFDLPDLPPGEQAAVRASLERLSTPAMRAELAAADPEGAARIHPNDRVRMRRALEILRLTGRPIGEWQRGTDADRLSRCGRVLYLILTRPRAELHARIDRRVAAMFSSGWIEEVAALRERGLGGLVRQRAPIGYAAVLDHVEGRISRGEAEEIAAARTRALARRQETWFRREPGEWLDLSSAGPDAIARRLDLFRRAGGKAAA